MARRAGLVIREIPVTWVYGRRSKVTLGSGARGFIDLLTVRWNQLRGTYPSRAAIAATDARSREMVTDAQSREDTASSR